MIDKLINLHLNKDKKYVYYEFALTLIKKSQIHN
jgi:hypothetical protein